MKPLSWSTRLSLLASAIYLPILGTRVIGIAGDEKTYLSQALDMSERSTWFFQTHLGEPNYYKGPLHYIALIAGLKVFGLSLWTAHYMNFIWILLGAWGVGLAVEKQTRLGFFAGAVWMTCTGIYSYSFASQMELSLAGFFALSIGLLESGYLLPFWCVAGLAGWLKSPLHSVLIGSSAVLFWLCEGSLRQNFFPPKKLFYAFIGILICSAGYAPAYFWDHAVFMTTYIGRETLEKPGNASPWWIPILPFFLHFPLPWTALMWTSIWSVLPIHPKRLTPPNRRLAVLGFCYLVVSIAFFIWHPYRVSHYNLPVTCGLVLIFVSALSTLQIHASPWRIAWLSMPLIFTLLTLALFLLFTQMRTPQGTWPWATVFFATLATAMSWKVWLQKKIKPIQFFETMAISAAIFYIGVGVLIAWMGSLDLLDLKQEIVRIEQNRKPVQISYFNLRKSVWNEWALTAYSLGRPTRSLNTIEDVRGALQQGDLIIAMDIETVDLLRTETEKLALPVRLQVSPWKRWRSHGRDAHGKILWRSAWNQRDAGVLRGDYYMVRTEAY